MGQPIPSTEERLAALEAALAAAQAGLAGLQEERDALAARLSTLEQTAGQGLERLDQAVAELMARRPPVRRRLQELEARLAEVLPPPAGTESPDGVGAGTGGTGGTG